MGKPKKGSNAHPVERARRILIVEDYADLASMISVALRLRGHITCVVADATAALAELTRFRPEVAIIETRAGWLDGHEIASALRSGAGSEACLLIGLAGDYGDERREAATFDYYLSRPIDVDGLFAVVNRNRRAQCHRGSGGLN